MQNDWYKLHLELASSLHHLFCQSHFCNSCWNHSLLSSAVLKVWEKSRGFYSRKYGMCLWATVVMLCIQNQNCESSMFEHLFTHKEPKWATWRRQQFACFFLVAGPVHAWLTVPWVFQWCPRCLSLVSLLVSGACGKRLGWEPSHAGLKHKPVLNPNPLLLTLQLLCGCSSEEGGAGGVCEVDGSVCGGATWGRRLLHENIRGNSCGRHAQHPDPRLLHDLAGEVKP